MIRFDDRKELEQRAERCLEDGLLEMTLGAGLIFLGVAAMMRISALAGIYFMLLIPVSRFFKRIVTVPRMHHLDFLPDPDSKHSTEKRRLLLSVYRWCTFVLGASILFCSDTLRIPLCSRFFNQVITGVSIASILIFLLLWAGSSLGRYRLLAAISSVLIVLCHWFDLGRAWYFAILGGATLLLGIAQIQAFLRQYPRLNGVIRVSRERLYRFAGERLKE